ncbi:glycerate kinase [Metabacillus herbersteinensis]|uniref:Glycerate kinase n=1 Tax=Metabacillus herbersteinensis TaxID=283816 RepID=A0ABV6GL18_9BACI
MNIIIAPDSFKGSISAPKLCSILKKGVLKVFPDANISEIPLADGGEGTLENMVYASGGRVMMTSVQGPLQKLVNASYGILGDNETVIIEMAQASGLPLVSEREKNPLLATSYGTGELIKHALGEGYRKFVIGLGGSATNDGGTGMLNALGVKFYDEIGQELKNTLDVLSNLSFLDDSEIDSRIQESSFTIASDVENTLCGLEGASFVFGPQKGATPEMVEQLDEALYNFSEVVFKQKNINMREIVGGGAAGGMGAALVTFLGAELKSGIEVVMDSINFEEIVQGVDLVITGEGKLDSQTLSGKVIAGVTKITNKYEIPVIALCGGLDLNHSQLSKLGVLAGFSIVPGPCTLDSALENAPDWAEDRIVQIMSIVKQFS